MCRGDIFCAKICRVSLPSKQSKWLNLCNKVSRKCSQSWSRWKESICLLEKKLGEWAIMEVLMLISLPQLSFWGVFRRCNGLMELCRLYVLSSSLWGTPPDSWPPPQTWGPSPQRSSGPRQADKRKSLVGWTRGFQAKTKKKTTNPSNQSVTSTAPKQRSVFVSFLDSNRNEDPSQPPADMRPLPSWHAVFSPPPPPPSRMPTLGLGNNMAAIWGKVSWKCESCSHHQLGRNPLGKRVHTLKHHWVMSLEASRLYRPFNSKLFHCRSILKKRRALEYKLRRRTKEKQDYLNYIQVVPVVLVSVFTALCNSSEKRKLCGRASTLYSNKKCSVQCF